MDLMASNPLDSVREAMYIFEGLCLASCRAVSFPNPLLPESIHVSRFPLATKLEQQGRTSSHQNDFTSKVTNTGLGVESRSAHGRKVCTKPLDGMKYVGCEKAGGLYDLQKAGPEGDQGGFVGAK